MPYPIAEPIISSRTQKILEITFYIVILCVYFRVKIDQSNIEELFQEYSKGFNKSYVNTTIYQQRFHAFQKSLEDIETLNSQGTGNSAHYGLTKYSDMFPEEFLESKLIPNSYHRKNLRLSSPSNTQLPKVSKSSLKFNIPLKVDWRQKNVITKVQNQESCGACWAFAAIGIIESMHAIETGRLEELSVQEMIDCDKTNNGCDGGDICSLLNWIKTEKVAIVKEKDYSLSLTKGKCRNITSDSSDVKLETYICSSFVDSEDILLALLATQGPVAVAINAKTWQNYIGGTIQFHCDDNPMNLNHAVQIVGYDFTTEIPHYIVRNSWGVDFGDEGYLYIAVGGNICGLAYEVSAVSLR